MQPLNQEKIEEFTRATNWQLEDTTTGPELVLCIQGQRYDQLARLVNQIAGLAESANHHPILILSFASLVVRLSTHDIAGVTSADLQLARQIDKLISQS